VTVTARPVEPTSAPTEAGRHRRQRHWRGAGLLAALGAAALLIALPSSRPDQSDGGPAMRAVADVWPRAEIPEIPANLPDGPAYSPAFFLDARTSLGTSPSPDGTDLRLVLRDADGAFRELRRLPIDGTPQYGGLVVAGQTVAWAESTTDDAGQGRTEMWAAELDVGAPPRLLTRDTGDVVFFNSQYDMVINDGQLHWVAVADDQEPATELRSVALTGGAAAVRTDPGAWSLSAWPFMVSAGTGQTGPVRLRDLSARRITDVPAGPTELVTCSPTWCRVLVLAGDGPGRIEMMRPDGSDRRPVGDGAVTASTIDVGVLDRFEVLSLSSAPSAATSSQQLLLYDLREDQTVVVAERVGMVLCRGGVLWWSTGDNETVSWHVLDLRTLLD